LTKKDKRSTKEEKPDAQASDREQPDKPNLSEDERKEIRQFTDRNRNRRRAPRLQVISKPGEPLDMDFGSFVEATRLMSAFGTSEIHHALLMLSGIVNAVRHGSPKNSELDINGLLAAVSGIGATDETEGMLATQMVATHAAAMTTLRLVKDSKTLIERDRHGEPRSEVAAHLRSSGRGAPALSRQGAAEGHGGACPRPCRRSGDRRRHHPGGTRQGKIG
jgi:hypothetical protein